jgi:hypothetical protein
MNRKRIVIVLCLVGLAAGALVVKSFGRQAQRAGNKPPQAIPRPEYVLYQSFFHQIEFLKRKADELEQQGRDGSGARSLIGRQTGLGDAQMQAVEQIAAECAEEVAAQDAKAVEVSKAYRARVEQGPTPDGYLPAPPAELREVQQGRNAIILRARDRIRAALSDEDFARLDAFVRQHGGAPNNAVIVPRQAGQTNR